MTSCVVREFRDIGSCTVLDITGNEDGLNVVDIFTIKLKYIIYHGYERIVHDRQKVNGMASTKPNLRYRRYET